MNILILIVLHNQLTIDRMNRFTTFMSNNHISCRILYLIYLLINKLVYHSLLLIGSFHPCPLKLLSTYISPLFIILLTFLYQTKDTSPELSSVRSLQYHLHRIQSSPQTDHAAGKTLHTLHQLYQ